MSSITTPKTKRSEGKACEILGCELPVHSQGWCKKHYDSWKNHRDPLWERSTTCKVDGCDRSRKSGKGYCDEHYRERKQRWDQESYRRHKESRLARERERRQLPEVKARKAAYSKVYAPRWRAENNERAKAAFRRDAWKRRSIELNAVGFCTEAQWLARLDFYGHCCYLCGCDWDALLSFDKTVDHVIPLSQGGTEWPSNLRPACRSCNSSKKAKRLADLVP